MYNEILKIECKPFLKWAGGKTKLLPELRKYIPRSFNRYFEPFLGGGAMFFDLQPARATLSDSNRELINCFNMVRLNPQGVIEATESKPYDREFYYELRKRSWHGEGVHPLERASRFLYFNKTCFNGLYRVNSKGQFNVPFGKYENPTIIDKENIWACSQALEQAQIGAKDFREALKEPLRGDFVYLDPPYVPISKTSNYTGFTREGFSMQDQTDLRDICRRLDVWGIKFLLSNSFTSEVGLLYQEFDVNVLEAPRRINSKGSSRGNVPEMLIKNY